MKVTCTPATRARAPDAATIGCASSRPPLPLCPRSSATGWSTRRSARSWSRTFTLFPSKRWRRPKCASLNAHHPRGFMQNHIALCALIAGAALLTACAKKDGDASAEAKKEVVAVATIDGKPISKELFEFYAANVARKPVAD